MNSPCIFTIFSSLIIWFQIIPNPEKSKKNKWFRSWNFRRRISKVNLSWYLPLHAVKNTGNQKTPSCGFDQGGYLARGSHVKGCRHDVLSIWWDPTAKSLKTWRTTAVKSTWKLFQKYQNSIYWLKDLKKYSKINFYKKKIPNFSLKYF